MHANPHSEGSALYGRWLLGWCDGERKALRNEPDASDMAYEDACQLEGKPWDWARARRLADACYPGGHGALSIEDTMGAAWLDGEQPPEFSIRTVKVPAGRVLQAAIRDYLAGSIDRHALERLAA